MKNIRLSSCFNLEDFALSETAIREGLDNTPPADVVEGLRQLAENVLEPVKAQFDTRPQISSGYRCPALNSRIGGVPDSQHITGQAVDFELPGQDLLEVACWMRDSLDYDQLLLERAGGKVWIHCSYVSPSANRREVKWFDGATWHSGLPEQ
jgi:hypothetical protein